MADLAGVAGAPIERLAVDDQAAADADLAGQVQDVVVPTAAPRRCSAKAPRSASLATVTGRPSSARPSSSPERDVLPAEVRGQPDEAIAQPDDADHGDADADE